MAQLEKNVRAIEKDGLLWGASKLVPIGFGIKKLQITLVIEDEKVSLDELQEQIQDDEDFVQSTDVVSNQDHCAISFAKKQFSKLCRSCRVLSAEKTRFEHDIRIGISRSLKSKRFTVTK